MIDITLVLVLAYSIAMVGIAFWSRGRAGKREQRNRYRDFAMASNDASWIAISASLFSLIGGGEIIALSAFAFIYGYAGIFLFVGYALAFAFMGIMASRARVSGEFLSSGSFSLPDFMEQRIGISARIVFLVGSILAFFSVLVLQFVTLGDLMGPISNVSEYVFTAITVITVAIYMSVGGFRSVLRTDIVQAAIMMTIMIALVIALFSATDALDADIVNTSTLMPIGVAVSLLIAGFFGGVASADVWQRMLAARNDKHATVGFSVGAIGLLGFGFLVVQIGLFGRQIEGINPDLVFSEVLVSSLSTDMVPFVVLLLLASIMSTVDTQSFLISGLVEREVSTNPRHEVSTVRFRYLVLGVLTLAATASLFTRNAVDIYTWLFSIFTVISPFVFGALFVRISSRQFIWVTVANIIIFGGLFTLGYVNLNNLYWLALTGLALFFGAHVIARMRSRANSQ